VAGGADDSYPDEGEARGRWMGAGTPELALEGEVEREQLGAVLSACDPRADAPLLHLLRRDRVPGFDVTFSAPKSVSVVWRPLTSRRPSGSALPTITPWRRRPA
jgi:conjugative relaxase-like TrwC/TraI family protein